METWLPEMLLRMPGEGTCHSPPVRKMFFPASLRGTSVIQVFVALSKLVDSVEKLEEKTISEVGSATLWVGPLKGKVTTALLMKKAWPSMTGLVALKMLLIHSVSPAGVLFQLVVMVSVTDCAQSGPWWPRKITVNTVADTIEGSLERFMTLSGFVDFAKRLEVYSHL